MLFCLQSYKNSDNLRKKKRFVEFLILFDSLRFLDGCESEGGAIAKSTFR